MPSPLIVTFFSGSGEEAGPFLTAPVVMSNLLPWHAQLMVPLATSARMHDWCVQTALNALNSPEVGWVTTTFWSAKILPPPTGTVALEIASLTALVAELATSLAAWPASPQPAKVTAPTATVPAEARTTRREGTSGARSSGARSYA